jgi:hypothetical protein
MSQQQPQAPADLATLMKMLGEFVVPGGSLLVSGNLRKGLAHLASGLIAKAVLGVPGLLLVHANSLSNFQSGKHLHKHLKAFQNAAEAGREAVPVSDEQVPAPPSPIPSMPSGGPLK